MKKWNDEGLIPLIVGVAIVTGLTIFGASYTVSKTEDFLSLLIVPSILIVVAILALSGRFMKVLGVHGSILLSIISFGFSFYLFYLGGMI